MAKKKTDKKKAVSSKTRKSLPKVIEVHYLKTKNYRTYHVDGIFGGVTPEGNLYMELFLQRTATPRSTEYEITNEGYLGAEIFDSRTGKSGIIREIESGLVMSMEVAKTIKGWIDEKITQYEKSKPLTPKKRVKK
jgi:hypothetical protein